MVEIYCTPTLPQADFLATESKLILGLTQKQLHSVQLYKTTASRQRSLLGTLLAKWVLAKKLSIPLHDIEFIRGKKGKPLYPHTKDVHFNISHAGDWVVVAVAPQAVGIDIEKTKTPAYRIAERYFSEEEQKDLFELTEPLRQQYFFDLWTLKESYLKHLGKGLTRSLNTFSINKKGDNFFLFEKGQLRDDIHLFSTKFDNNYTLSACSNCDNFNKSFFTVPVDKLIPKG